MQELVDKANDGDILQQCPDIKWHFIGHLQSNKVNKVLCKSMTRSISRNSLITTPDLPVAAANLDVIETLDSQKLAATLDKSWSAAGKAEKLKIFVQVNTSGEDSEFDYGLFSRDRRCLTLAIFLCLEDKSGLGPEHVVELIRFVHEKCQHLQLTGLMTIGAYGYDVSKGANPDFVKLAACRQQVCQTLSLDPNDMELSMGMSTDFEHAVSNISSNDTLIWI